MYFLGPNGAVIRVPHEDFKPIDSTHPWWKTDFAKLEQDLLKTLENGK
jgi:hypothetical protein